MNTDIDKENNTFKDYKQETNEILNNYCYFSLVGDKAFEILQNLITNDINLLSAGNILYSLLCNQQGNIIADTAIFKHGDKLIIRTDKSTFTNLTTHIEKYCRFAKINLHDNSSDFITLGRINQKTDNEDFIENMTNYNKKNIIATSSIKNLAEIILLKDNKTINLISNQAIYFNNLDQWDSHLITNGISKINHLNCEKFNPLQTQLNTTRYISYNKGCYLGQEIIARLAYKAKAKYQLASIISNTKTTPNPHDKILLNETKIGTVINKVSIKEQLFLLCSIKIELIENLQFIMINNNKIMISKLQIQPISTL